MPHSNLLVVMDRETLELDCNHRAYANNISNAGLFRCFFNQFLVLAGVGGRLPTTTIRDLVYCTINTA